MLKRNNRHIWAGMGFVLAAIMTAGAIYYGVKATVTGNSNAPTAADIPRQRASFAPEPLPDQTAPAKVVPAAETGGQPKWLVGTWVAAGSVGVSSGIKIVESCETDNVVVFRTDGTYQEGGPNIDGDDNSDSYGVWSLAGGSMTYNAASGAEYSSTIERVAPFAMIETGYRGSGSERLVRCGE